MKITRLTLKNLGRHASIDQEFHSSVVGILGPNGCGKSTLLQALEFAFTGSLPDKNETYVRNFGAENGAANAMIHVEFEKNGIVGVIDRQIGKTDKRSLQWDGATYTKAKDVDTAMAEILGADKDAITNAAFIPQGELDRLFFGQQSEREQLFMRLLLLTYMDKVSSVVEGKVKALNGALVDLAPLVDELNKQREQNENAVVAVRTRLEAMPDWASDITNYRGFQTARTRADEAIRTVEFQTTEIRDREERVRALLGNTLDLSGSVIGSSERLTTLIGETAKLIASSESAWHEATRIEGLIQLSTDIADDEHSIASEVEQLSARRLSLQAVVSKPLEEINQRIFALQSREQAQQQLPAAEAAMMNATQVLQAFDAKPAPVSTGEIAQLEANLDVNKSNLMEVQLKLDLRRKVKEMTCGHAPGQCPVCDQAVDPAKISDESVLVDLENQHRGITAVVTSQTQELQKARRDIQQHIDDRNRLTTTASQASTRYAELSAKVSEIAPGDIAELRRQQAEITSARAQLQTVEQSFQQIQRREQDLAAKRSRIKPEDVDKIRTFDAGSPKSTWAAVEMFRGFRTTLDNLQTNLQPLANDVNSAKAIKAQAEQTHATQSKASDEFRAALTPRFHDLCEQLGQTTDAMPEMERMQSTREQVVGELNSAEAGLSAVKARQHELERRQLEDAGKRALIDDLRKLQMAFSRQGLPMAYIRYKFGQLVHLTNPALASLAADFTVAADPERDVSFIFTRSDEAEPYVMQQSKLSGGQRVRLTVAFLRAVQKLILPDLGLLILDEPSLHLDAPGKEELANMLTALQFELGNSSSQIIVCDHAPELQPAFGNVVILQ